MYERTCPHCHKAFTIDEAGYVDLVKQMRDEGFARALERRLELAENETRAELVLAEAKLTSGFQEAQAKEAAEIERLKGELKASDVARQPAVELAQAKVANALKDEAAKQATAKQLAVTTAVTTVEKERDALARDLEAKATEQKLLESSLREACVAEVRAKGD